MKPITQNQNKWFLTAALLGALVLNSGLWQMKQNLMNSSDLSSTVPDPAIALADLKAKKAGADQLLETAKQELARAKADWEAAKVATNKEAEEPLKKKALDDKQLAFNNAEAAAKTAASNLSTYEEGIKRLATAAGVSLPAVPCDSPDCREKESLKLQLAAALAQIPKATVEKEKTTDELERERTQAALDRVNRACKDRDDREEKLLKCYTSELLEVLENNKGDKRLVKKMVVKFYEEKIDESLRRNITSTNRNEVVAALEIVRKFERSLPTDYNYIRDEVTDTARQSAKQIAVTSQDYLKAADRVRTEDPGLATEYLRSHGYYRDLFSATTTHLNNALRDGLQGARKENLISDSYMRSLYETRWKNGIVPVARGLFGNPRNFKIEDEDDFAFDHMIQQGISIGLNLASNVASGSRRQGRNGNTRVSNVNRGDINNSKLTDRNLDTIFGTLGTSTGRNGSGRRARSQ